MSEDNKKKVDHFIEFLDKNKKLILVSLIAVFVIAAGSAGYNSYMQKQQIEAYGSLFSIEKNIGALESEKAKKTDYSKVLQQLNQFITSNDNKNAKYFAALGASEIFVKEANIEKALETISAVTQDMDSKFIYFGLLHMYEATLAMDLNKFDVAMEALNKVLTHNEFKFLHAEALIKQGVCYEKLDKIDQAKNTYKRVSEEFKDSAAGKSATVYLRMLQINEG